MSVCGCNLLCSPEPFVYEKSVAKDDVSTFASVREGGGDEALTVWPPFPRTTCITSFPTSLLGTKCSSWMASSGPLFCWVKSPSPANGTAWHAKQSTDVSASSFAVSFRLSGCAYAPAAFLHFDGTRVATDPSQPSCAGP